MQQACIRLADTSPEDLDDICDDVHEIANKTDVDLNGPIPLSTKTLEVPARKPPDGEGTATREHREMRVRKHLIDLDVDERTLRQLAHVQVPNDVNIEIVLED